MGRTVLDNPELPPSFIVDTLTSLKQAKAGFAEDYSFD